MSADEPTMLTCGCTYEPGDPGKFTPCCDLHKQIAERYRKAGAAWVILAVPS